MNKRDDILREQQQVVIDMLYAIMSKLIAIELFEHSERPTPEDFLKARSSPIFHILTELKEVIATVENMASDESLN